jgi:hypothetical protein
LVDFRDRPGFYTEDADIARTVPDHLGFVPDPALSFDGRSPPVAGPDADRS